MKEYSVTIHDGADAFTKDKAMVIADRFRDALVAAIAMYCRGKEGPFDPTLIRVVNALSVEYIPEPNQFHFADSFTQFKIQYRGRPCNIGDLELVPDGSNIRASLLFDGSWPVTDDIMDKIVEQIRIILSGRL